MYPDPRFAHEKVRRLVRRRRLLRRLRTGAKVAGGLLVFAALATGGTLSVAVVHRVWQAHHRPHVASASRTAERKATTTTTTTPGPGPCTGGAVEARQSHWQVAGGTLYEVVVLDGTAATPCTLSGYAGLSVTGVDGATVGAPVHDDPGLGAPAGATPGAVVLGSGEPAWFEISYSVACTTVLGPGQSPSGAPGQCARGRALGVLLPQGGAPLAVPQPLGFTFTPAGFDVGPFGPGAPPGSAPVRP